MSLLQNRLFLFVVIFSAVMCIAFPSFSYDIYVNKTEDTNDGICNDDDCSLREAIIEANTTFGAGLATIHVPAGRYFITREGSGEDNAETGDLDIKNSMTIVGEGMDATIINAIGLFGVHDRVFHVNAPYAEVSFEDLGIYGGYIEDGNGGGVLISNAYKVEFLRCHLYHNYADYGGAIRFTGVTSPVENQLNITESVVDRNEASIGGGGLWVKKIGLGIDRSTINGNSASEISGGLYADSIFTEIINSTFYKNVASVASEMYFLGDGYGLFSHSTLVASDLNIESSNIRFGAGNFSLSFFNSIVWGKCYPTLSEGFVTLGGNMGEPSNTCGFGESDIIDESDPVLLPLGDYGGPTPTAPPGLRSRAIENGVIILNYDNPEIDQRGVERPQAVYTAIANYDIGSVERESFENIFKDIIHDLRYMVKAPSISSGIQKSLYYKVENSDKSYDRGNFVAAVKQLRALNNSVEAQREKALTVNQADNIIFLSNEAITFLKNED